MKNASYRLACVMIALACQTTLCDHKGGPMAITVTSLAFAAMQAIPSKFTCDGENVSPPLSWSGVPGNAKSIVLIGDDPDAPAGTWVHWVCYDIPASVDTLAEGVAAAGALPFGGSQGINDFRKPGYGGPCPPGGTHRYFFKVYALDVMLNLPKGKAKKDIERAMKGHVIASGELIGTYSRRRP
jgi:Raf kinase inhibitor-like YbhB/YbcL family protein